MGTVQTAPLFYDLFLFFQRKCHPFLNFIICMQQNPVVYIQLTKNLRCIMRSPPLTSTK